MQRRNVDLPDPDGPRMHITSPGTTSREIPFRTSSRPKYLCTPSALTIRSDAAKERRLAGSGRAEDAHHLAGNHVEGNSFQNLEPPEILVHPFGFDHQIGCSEGTSTCRIRTGRGCTSPRREPRRGKFLSEPRAARNTCAPLRL